MAESSLYTVCPEKRDQNIFYNISYKTRAILMKFGVPCMVS